MACEGLPIHVSTYYETHPQAKIALFWERRGQAGGLREPMAILTEISS
jgi:hypothetical protein